LCNLIDENSYRSDRHNIIQIRDEKSVIPLDYAKNTLFVDSNRNPDKTLINKFAFIEMNSSECLNWERLLIKNNQNHEKARLGSFFL
jgi:hypothetical protein